MNKYRDKSYFEINKAVAECKYGIGCTGKTQGGDVIVFTDSFTAVFDPCNNPADAMPIIIENGISMVRVNNEWSASQFNNHCIEVNDGNYYRAAMICFLMMKDAENEKS
ncbi:phage protein NinX family protein [Morganella morganii]|nr:DUF2591 domain-containing protein [Morganella morganii]